MPPGSRGTRVLRNHLSVHEVLFHNAIQHGGRERTIPGAFRVDYHHRAEVAGIEAAGLGRPHLSGTGFQATCGQPVAQMVVEITGKMSRATGAEAEERMVAVERIGRPARIAAIHRCPNPHVRLPFGGCHNLTDGLTQGRVIAEGIRQQHFDF